MNKEIIKCECINDKKCVKCAKKIDYANLKIILKDIELLTTNDEWNQTNKTRNDKIKIKCINNNCNNIRILPIKGINYDTKMCKECSKHLISQKILKYTKDENQFHNYEENTFNKLTTLLINDFIIKKTNDGCYCDMYIKPINMIEDKWMQIQIKTSKYVGRNYSFSFHNNIYTNMVVILNHLIDNKIWLIKGDLIPSVNKLTIGKKKSIYDKYIVDDNDIKNNLIIFYNSLTLYTEKFILEQLSKTNLTEHLHRKKREEILKNIFNIKYPSCDNLSYDLEINNYKIQDKSGRVKTKNNKTYFEFVLKKGKNGSKWYNINDNDFYWLYNNINSKFLIIPQNELYKLNYIKSNNDDIKLKSSLTINFDSNNKLINYIFDYNNLDIIKLKKLFTCKK